jgi:uncharacterized coiled-coil protein SlyX
MIRTWTMFGLSAVLTLSLAASALTGEPAPAKPKSVEERLAVIEDSLAKSFPKIAQEIKEVRGDIAEAKVNMNLATARLTALENAVKTLQGQVDAIQKRLPPSDRGVALYPPVDRNTLQDLQNKLTEIQQTLNKLQSSSRVAMSSPAPSLGRVVLVNSYPDESLLFVLNGHAYTLAPNTQQTVENIPVGTLTYEVFSPRYGLRRSNTLPLAANETVTLTAYR